MKLWSLTIITVAACSPNEPAKIPVAEDNHVHETRKDAAPADIVMSMREDGQAVVVEVSFSQPGDVEIQTFWKDDSGELSEQQSVSRSPVSGEKIQVEIPVLSSHTAGDYVTVLNGDFSGQTQGKTMSLRRGALPESRTITQGPDGTPVRVHRAPKE